VTRLNISILIYYFWGVTIILDASERSQAQSYRKFQRKKETKYKSSLTGLAASVFSFIEASN
jgi:hypothetical protein